MILLLMYAFFISGTPIILIILFGVVLCRYIYAKAQNRKAPGTFSPEEIKKRKILLIVLSAVLAVLAAVVIGFISLMNQAVANM